MSALRFEVIDAAAERHAALPTINLRLRVSETTGAAVHAVALRAQIRIEAQRRHYDDDEGRRLYELFGERLQWGESLRPFLWTHVATMVPAFRHTIDVDLPVTCTYDLEVTASKYLDALAGGEVPLLLLFSGTTFSRPPLFSQHPTPPPPLFAGRPLFAIPPTAAGDGPVERDRPVAGVVGRAPADAPAPATAAVTAPAPASAAPSRPAVGGGFVAEPVSWNEDAAYRMPVRVWRDMIDRYFPNSGWLRLGRDTIEALNRFKTARALPTWDRAMEQLLREAGEDR